MGARKLSYYREEEPLKIVFSKFGETLGENGCAEKKCLNYFTFGMQLPNRNGNTSETRYGFNGMEKDDEIKGEGNSYDFGARIYDPRVGRWLSRDPKYKAYESPYVGIGNNPIIYVDPDGKDIVVGFKGTSVTNDWDPAGHTSMLVTDYRKVQKKINGVVKEVYVENGYLYIENNNGIHIVSDSKSEAIGRSYSQDGIVQITKVTGTVGDDGETYYTEDQIQSELTLVNKAEKLQKAARNIKAGSDKVFDITFYNCTDFVCELLLEIGAVENVDVGDLTIVGPVSNKERSVSTPNGLYQYLTSLVKGFSDVKLGGDKNKLTKESGLKVLNSNAEFNDATWEKDKAAYEKINQEFRGEKTGEKE